MKHENERKILRGAIEFLRDEKHWTKGTYSSRDGKCCAYGALRKTQSDLGIEGHWGSHSDDPVINIEDRMRGLVTRGSTVEGWNDAAERTHAEVLAGLGLTLSSFEQEA